MPIIGYDNSRALPEARSSGWLARGVALMCSGGALLLGGLIYLGFRAEHLRMFSWARSLHLDGYVDALRARVASADVPDVVLYSVPDGLWIFSYVALTLTIWGDNTRMAGPFAVALPLMAIGSEVAQGMGWLRGTFDVADLACYVLGVAFGIIFAMLTSKRAITK